MISLATSIRTEPVSGHSLPFSSWPVIGRPAGHFPADSLGEEGAAFYRDRGFLVAENALSPAEVAELNEETLRICRNEAGNVAGIGPATPGETDDDVLARVLCIHFPHKINAVMRRVMSHPSLVNVLTRTISPNVKSMQSMLFVKGSGKPGQAWHQDEFFIPTRDRSLCGGWIALDDATLENGCLWVIPGSHKRGILWEMHDHYDTRFDCTQEAQSFPYTDADSVPVEVKAGSVVFFNGYLLHRSLPNRARGGYRRSLVNHYMSAESLLPWMGTNKDYRDILMVAGSDPYAYKGTSDEARPHVRPSGEGGCESWKKKGSAASDAGSAPAMGASMAGPAMGA